jgi:hypothetical protein
MRVDIRRDTGFNLLHCPRCGEDAVHVEYAYVAAPGPNGDVQSMRAEVFSMSARPSIAPAAEEVGGGYGCAVSIAGYCEQCPKPFAISFVQNQGVTEVWLTDWDGIRHPVYDEPE